MSRWILDDGDYWPRRRGLVSDHRFLVSESSIESLKRGAEILAQWPTCPGSERAKREQAIDDDTDKAVPEARKGVRGGSRVVIVVNTKRKKRA